MSNVTRVDLYVRDVETDSIVLTARNADGTIKDLSGYTGSAKFRLTRASTAVILTLASGTGAPITILPGAVAGNVTMALTPASKATLRAALVDTVGVWGLALTNTGGTVYVQWEGEVAVSLSIPR